MSDALQDVLQPVIVRWTMGGAAAPLAPEGLREKLGDDQDEAEIRLLALAGQALSILVVPEPSGALQGLPDLPELVLPTLRDELRPVSARLLARQLDWLRNGVLALLEARGRVVHPGDWMPSRTGTVPLVYAPWQDWLAGISKDVQVAQPEWDDLGPAGRRAMITRLRAADPAAALALIREKASGEGADARLWMTQALGVNLGEDDRSFIEGLAKDRAPRVRTIASRLLMRLGTTPSTADGGVEGEIGDFVRVQTKGIFNKQKTIMIVKLRNEAQRTRRSDTMARLDAHRLSATLGVEDVDLAAMWPWGDDRSADREFVDVLVGTGSTEVVASFEDVVANGADIDMFAIMDVMERLSDATMATLAQRAYAAGQRLPSLVSCMPRLGIIDDFAASPEWRSLLLQLLRQDGVQANTGTDELLAMGLLVTARAAREIVDKLAKAGIPGGDPRMDALRLNAAL